MRAEGIEPPIFGSGIQRVAIAPRPLLLHMFAIYIFLVITKNSKAGN